MAGGFVKLYGDKLLDSSVWIGTPSNVKILWIAMLALADQHGRIIKGLPGLVHRSDLTREEVLAALKFLEAPDPDSQTKTFEGRRVKLIEGGWQLLTYKIHREYRTDKQVKEAERKAVYRDRKAQEKEVGRVPDVPVSPRRSVPEAEAEAEAEAEIVSSEGLSHQEDTAVVKECPASENLPVEVGTNLPVPRDQKWLQLFINRLDANVWREHRATKEARVAFNFHRWRNNIKNRTIFSVEREKTCAKYIEQYGLIRVLFAIEGQLTLPDFNPHDKGVAYRGWENLFRKAKGYENIEKCSNWAIQKEHGAKVAAAIKQLVDARGWTPSEADEELYETLGG